ncbi:MAG: glycosyltransferase [Acetobacteraceae bacterium]|nr:glycosyltransferase [Acetobacteraceae bacterium]
MRFVYFTHSLQSCWNHGNAHFLRGVLRELVLRGHEVAAYEPNEAWSRQNLIQDAGLEAADAWQSAYPELSVAEYARETDASELADGADVVIVHEWNEPHVVAQLAGMRRGGAGFVLLFHDTHHRAISDPAAMSAYDLDGYDAVLAFGEALAEVYRGWGWGERVFVWHEAADTRLFRPPELEPERNGAVWIGNWGDGERTAELETFLLAPARAAGLALDVHGVRYPPEALALLARYGARWEGWLPNHRVPEVFAQHELTVHVPRRFYATELPGIPTIRVFEALACGIPLISAPWEDREALFTPGRDYLVARDGAEMERHMRTLHEDPARRAELAAHGLETIGRRHTCAHRADELLHIVGRLRN